MIFYLWLYALNVIIHFTYLKKYAGNAKGDSHPFSSLRLRASAWGNAELAKLK